MSAPLCRLCGALAIVLWLGCAGGPDASKPRAEAPFAPSGFLGDYSALRPGGKDRARLVYLDAGADFSGYERVVIDPVVVFRSDPARFAGIPPAQLDALASEFRAELERAFGAEFAVADAAGGPGTLRVRTALTAAITRDSDAERLQYIEVELELRDAATQARLAAAVDSKGERPSGASDTSQAVHAKEVFKDWAETAAVRVATLRDVDRSSP